MNCKLNIMPPKKFLFLLFFVPSTFSFFLLFSITIRTRFSHPLHPTPARINLTSTKRLQHVSHASYDEAAFTTKEYFLVSDLVSRKAPCNLLFFGFIPQFLRLASLNAKGITVFLEDDQEKIKIISETGRLRAYKVEYNTEARNAYRLLKHAREHFHCKLEVNPVRHDVGCGLALDGLPSGVHDTKWDIVVVDGPRGDRREAPGRMRAIYTAAVIARRAGNVTDVLVHDVDRMVEKWYSWEFLCQHNLVSSKGNLWHFEVEGNSGLSKFCPENNIHIL